MTIDTAIQSAVIVHLIACCVTGIVQDLIHCKPETEWFVPFWHVGWTVLLIAALIHLGTFR